LGHSHRALHVLTKARDQMKPYEKESVGVKVGLRKVMPGME
jgi:hypothetical protein